MKLSKTKKIILLIASLTLLTTSIVTPIVILNKDEKNKENDVDKVVKILEEKNDKTIILSSNSTGKIIANNQEKIIEKIKTLIGQSNLKGVKIEVSMQSDTNISTAPQKIIIKLTKNKISKEIKDFLVKREFTDIEFVKNILDSKTEKDLKIILLSNSNGNIIGNTTNKNAIERKLRILIDPSNTSGDSNHSSLRGTTISISMTNDAPISTSFQNIIVSISKIGGATLRTTNIFQVKKHFTADEDITAIKEILDTKTGNELIIILPNNSNGNIIGNVTNKNAIITKLRKLVDSSNINDEANHPSLRGTTINVSMSNDVLISTTLQNIVVSISKIGGTTLTTTKTFRVQKDYTNASKITNYFGIIDNRTLNIYTDFGSLNSKTKILVAIKNHLASDNALWTSELQSLITTHSSETENSIIKNGSTVVYSIAYNDDSDNIQKVDLTISYFYSNAQKITNYFANNAKKNITISGEDLLSTKAKILTAIKNHLANDDGVLWTSELQSLITTHGSETETSIIKNGPTITYSIAYNDDSNNIQKVDLAINYVSYTNAQKITNYFANSTKKNIVIFGGNALDTKAKILVAIKNHLASDDSSLWTSELQSLITTHSSETENSIIKNGSTVVYSIAYNDDSDNIQKVDLTISYFYSNAQKITNYFANNAKKNITISGEDLLNTKAKILTAIKNHLASDDSYLWNSSVQSLITTHDSETKTSITKDGPTVIYSIAYNDDLNNIQKVDLAINYVSYTNAQKIRNYFANNAKKNIVIFGGNALDTKAKILTAIKNHLASDDSSLWTSELQSLITTHDSETKTSITKGGPKVIYSIAYNDDSGSIQKVDLAIDYGYTNAQKITNYFNIESNKKFLIYYDGIILDTEAKILAIIKFELSSKDLWTNELQSLITTHSSETETSIMLDGPTVIYSIAYNDDSGNIQKVDLEINYIGSF